MRRAGALTSLRRESHPFVALALLALVVPALLAAAAGAPAIAGESPGQVVCAAGGVAPGGAGDGPPRAHHDALCCGTVCPHGGGCVAPLLSAGFTAETAPPRAAAPRPAETLAGGGAERPTHAIRGPPLRA